jgi:hypothetical protein
MPAEPTKLIVSDELDNVVQDEVFGQMLRPNQDTICSYYEFERSGQCPEGLGCRSAGRDDPGLAAAKYFDDTSIEALLQLLCLSR